MTPNRLQARPMPLSLVEPESEIWLTDDVILAEMERQIPLAFAAGFRSGWWRGFAVGAVLSTVGAAGAVGAVVAWGWM